jgi:hypothetical protein
MKHIGRLAVGGISALLGIAGATDAIAQTSRRVSPEQAPPSWMAYAQTVSEAIRSAISSEEPVAVRLKAHLDATRTDPSQPSVMLPLKLWVDAKGVIMRVEFAPFADAEANTDLTNLLVGRAVGSAPPRKMLLPLRLTVQLQPASPTAAAPN